MTTTTDTEVTQLRHLVTQLSDHLERMGFPFGKPHGPTCECEDCEAWTDMQHARMSVNHPKAPEIETNPYKV